MKNLVLIIFSVFVLFNVSCKPDKCCFIPQSPARITAQKNGVSWSSLYVKATLSDLDSLRVEASATTDSIYPIGKLDSLTIKILYTEKGTYHLHGNQASYATFSHGATKNYTLDTTYNNTLAITGYETIHNSATTNPDVTKITGTFDLRFIDPNNPAGLSFSNGAFYTIISK